LLALVLGFAVITEKLGSAFYLVKQDINGNIEVCSSVQVLMDIAKGLSQMDSEVTQQAFGKS
jgi:hypothetical protein